MARKRDLVYQQQELMIDQPYHPPGGVQNSSDYWNSKAWNWDCTRFVAQPVDANAMNLDTPVQSVQSLRNGSKSNQVVAEDDGSLSLKLGSGSGGSSFDDEPALRPSKRVAGSYVGSGYVIPGGIGNANRHTCQVDSCMVDLSNDKDYHRRHKVCEFHSKATQALVGKQMQRFCQQCSRFHVLSEFDEGKRSCRRRLAGHNRRRRKAQPDEVTPRLLATGGQQNAVHTGLDLVGLLAALTGSKGNEDNVNGSPVVVPNKEQLIQLISKIGSLPSPAEANSKLPETDNFNKTASKASPEHLSGSSGNSSSQSTLNLFGDLPRASQVSVPDLFTIPSQRSGRSSDSERTKSASTYQQDPFNARKRTNLDLAFTGREKSSNICHSPEEYSNSQVHDTQGKLPLQLFCSSPEDNNSPPNMENSSKYFSSDSSNQNEDRSPLSSPGVQLFPVKSSKHIVNHERVPHANNAKPPAGKTSRGAMSFDLFGGSNKGVEVDLFQRSTNKAGHTSPGSDVSPSSSTCCAQDLTRRILIKLFGKSPNHLPEALRSEMFAWLSNTPSQMESYIRPGCVILSIYVSMPSASWEQLDQNLLEYASWLLQRNIDIWKDGRFLIQTGKQLVSHNNGKLRLCKSWITPKAPELISVSPLAIVGGHETRICLTGRNLNFGTKIHCTFMGGYNTKELPDTTVQNSTFNRTTLCSCEIHLDAPSGTGRYFIEVENGFKGNCFPIIIADSSICKELRQLEFELEADLKLSDTMPDEKESDGSWPRAEILHFLNELGWLFQMKRDPSNNLEYSIHRFKFLLTFSVERDFSVLIKKLLDTLVEDKMGNNGIPAEVSEMVSAVQLLHCAVKRKCRKMVDMLINYSLVINDPEPSKIYVFLPNTAGPGGLTPLHIAACTSGSEDLVDALTNDPLELGLSCWKSQLDASGQSPYAYATSRNNHSYNRLVARKLADRRNNQISLSVDENETMEQTFVNSSPTTSHQSKHKAVSCSQCAIAAARCSRRKVPGSHGMVARPFILSMLAIAAVCVCVCLYFRGHPYTGMDSPFTWEKLHYGTI